MENNFYYEDVVHDDLRAEKATSYTPAPAGTFMARCIGFIQLGTQNGEYQGKPGKQRGKIMMVWELPEETCVFEEAKGPKPFTISQVYSLIISEKSTWRNHMEGWL